MTPIRPLPYADARWFQLLKAAIEAEGSNITIVARKLGYGRPAISQVVNGIYAGKPDKIAAKVMELMDRWGCPYLNTEIVAEDCRAVHSGPTPSHDPARLAQRRVCRTCKHNGGSDAK